MAEAMEDLLAVPDKRAAKLAGISMAQLRYWEKVGLVVPSTRTKISQRNIVRLYSFTDMMELMVAATLRTQRGMTFQRIQKVYRQLRNRGYDSPLRELRYATVGNEIYFQHPDGSWEGDLQPHQTVLATVLNLEPLRQKLATSTKRAPEMVGQIAKVRGVHASKPVIAGTRIRVSTVRAFLDAGYDVDGILEEYPDLTAEDGEAVRELAAAS